ncbi:ATP-dependent helicase DinG [Luminiphilus syltensis NOR5-1B]|uniref:ATP-dependent DNA helicase DinG n=1 Tax=Luminiphilus syltensis NOR5-1B TaxID=565045 RepID=B8KSR7_9GAMM|nr:ATP-dependent DNA helicase DinG [Luminiphilus syltensis]EED34453.1 ATP-dependent helicase DinG [Luminiphilus syltensis NOR5-1B]
MSPNLLDEAMKEEIRAAYLQLVSSRGLAPRVGQRQMIAEIANALGDPQAPEPIAVVEAGTGTGKTIAYTVAALPVARARQKQLVIATATVALQEQLISKDLPDILHHSGLNFRVQLAKGRGRYVCLQKLDHQLEGRAGTAPLIPLYPDEMGASGLSDAGPVFEAMLDALAGSSWDGDLDNWTGVLEPSARRAVTTDHVQCSGRRCPHVTNCSFFKARDGLLDADVIVTNHDLVLSDLKLGGGVILPAPEDCLIIFDEGHQLPDKCLSHFTLSAPIGVLRQSMRDAGGWIARDADSLGLSVGDLALLEQLESSAMDLDQLLDGVGAWCWDYIDQQDGESRDHRFEHGIAPTELIAMATPLADSWRQHLSLAQRFEMSIEGHLENAQGENRDLLEIALVNAGTMVARAESQCGLWSSYSDSAEPDELKPWARWMRHSGSEDSITLLASPVLAGDLLHQHIWSRVAGAVVTSATLSALGTFDRFRSRSGVPQGARFKQVISPFDSKRAQFIVPPMSADPSDAAGHTVELIELLPQLVANDRGTLVLFSSRRQMEEVAAGIEATIDRLVLMQDTLSKGALLDRHRDHIDAGHSSMILGLASFAEGIDLPGVYCDHVIIAKLPFAVPDSPLEAAHAELLERQGRNPFMEISVPDAALKLVQASGRLLRTETDSGTVTLLDRRVITRRYGRAIMDSLPRFEFNLAP